MKILLFGADGYIGSSINADVRTGKRDVDLTDYQAVLELIKRQKPTHIISAASRHGSYKEMQKDHHRFLRENILIDSNILEAASKCEVANVSIISSISGLPESEHPSTESMISMGPVGESNFGYNFSKYASIQLVKSYQKDGFENFQSFLLGNVYGFNKKFNRNTNVVATLIKQMYDAKINNSSLALYGNGLDARCFTHLNDVSNLIEKLVRLESRFPQPVIISTSQAHTISELANSIAASMNFENEVIFLDKDDINQTIKKIENSNLIEMVGPHNFVTLSDGIQMTVRDYLSDYGSK